MELKPGYKQTEVGVIPEAWGTITLERASVAGGLVRGPFGGALKKEIFVKDGKKVYEQRNAIYRDGTIGNYFINDTKFIELKRFAVSPGDFIVSCSGTIGRIFKIPRDAQSGVINQALLKIKTNRDVVDSDYFFHYFDWDEFQRRIVDNTHGGAMQNLVGMTLFRTVELAHPPLPEQRAIAGALSDVDALIAALDRLIVKKRDLKQAAMQQLLTGQTRLPGFSGEWEVKRLGGVIEIKKGQLITEKNAQSGTVPVIAGGMKPAYYHNRANRIGKTITVSGSGANAGFVAFHNVPIFASDCSTISEANNYSIKFVFYQLLARQELIYKAQTGGAQPHIHPVDLMPMEIGVPNLREQTAIAAVLSDMDAEIAALEARRDKTRTLKQGMMQELLTGRTRLV
ncbi:MAG: restriction endonuclease subunit S [Anaerolineae bacterium]|nr:restriction endonuclease subunit S [Anaerolineae bacterium]